MATLNNDTVFTTESLTPSAPVVTVQFNDESPVTREVTKGTTLAGFIVAQATAKGIKTFSVYLDDSDSPATQSQVNKVISADTSVRIVSKDARGIDQITA